MTNKPITIEDQLRAIRVPRNMTALMQLLQQYAQAGHWLWQTDSVSANKLDKLIPKLDKQYNICRDVPARAYAKLKGQASVHLVAFPVDNTVRYWLVSTKGRHGLEQHTFPGAGPVRDLTLRGHAISYKNYELLRLPKKSLHEGEQVSDVTWTWRVNPLRVREHQAFIVQRARQHDLNGLLAEIAALEMMPMFSATRRQVQNLRYEAQKIWGKFNKTRSNELELFRTLPIMQKLKIYHPVPLTLFNLWLHAQSPEPELEAKANRDQV